MTLRELFSLDSKLLIKFMREEGITSLSYEGNTITLSPTPTSVKGEVEPSRFDDDAAAEKLPCGHSIWEANELNECLFGCLDAPKEETN